MPWWLWMLFGLVLLILEVQLTGGFYLAFFGIGALCVGFLVAIGLAQADWLQWLLFSALSLVTLGFLRRPIMMRLAPAASNRVDGLVGETAIACEEIPSGGVGKAELRGTTWTARNCGSVALAKDTRCRVERVDGLTIWIRPE
jgi:membrane protein implicated in regulation of membrane protease activity